MTCSVCVHYMFTVQALRFMCTVYVLHVLSAAGPPKQPPRERESRGPPPERQRSLEERPSSRKEPGKGYPAHGYTEVFDIESGSDLEEPTPVIQKQADPNLSVAERAREGQPLLPTPPMEKRTPEASRMEHHPTREPPRRHGRSREGEFEERRRDVPVADLREKIRGGGAGRGRSGSHDTHRDRRSGPDTARPEGRRQPQAPEQESPLNTEDSTKNTSKSQDKLDAIPSTDSSLQQSHSSKDFEKYDLNSIKVAIVDDLNPSVEGRFSPSVQGEFVEVQSRNAKKEKNRKEKEEMRKQEERQKEDEKRKKGRAPGKQSDKAPPTDNKPLNAWSNTANPPWKETALPAANVAPGSQLSKSTSTPSPGVIGQAAPAKQAVPHTAELLPVSQPYSLFGGPPLSPFPSGNPTGILESAIDSTVPGPGAAKLQVPPAAETVSNKSTPPVKDTKTASSFGGQPQSDVKPKKESGDVRKSEGPKLGKNLPPRLKSQQTGSGRGRRLPRDRDGGGEKKERRVGKQGNEERADKGGDKEHKERGREEQPRAKVRSTVLYVYMYRSRSCMFTVYGTCTCTCNLSGTVHVCTVVIITCTSSQYPILVH